MGAKLFIIFAVLLYTVKIIANTRHLTFDKWCEIFISFFIFTNCLSFGLPLIELNSLYVDGALGTKFRLEVFMIITPIFFVVMARRAQWKFIAIPWYVIFGIVFFCALNLLNPNNMAVGSTAIAMAEILCYLIFLYIICSCVPAEVIMRGLYEGFVYTTILQALLAICYPIMGINQVVELFREGVSIRALERPGAPGTFSHPNVLGGYMAYIFTFFAACFLTGYRKRKSLFYTLASFFVLIFTFSRSAWLAAICAFVVMILLYITRNGVLFSIKNIFTRILPLLIVITGIFFLTPLKDSIIGSNMDEMMVARIMHYYCGYETISEHPIIGVGLNAHLEYVRTHIDPRIFAFFDQLAWNPEEFLFTNPIHNIHLIFLAELGLVGFLPILYFIIYKFRKIKGILRDNTSVEYRSLELFCIGLLCCLLIHGMSDWAPLNLPLRNIWIFAFFTAAFAKHGRNDVAPTSTPVKG